MENEVKNESRIPSKIKGNWLYFASKRIFDFIMSLIAIILLSWLLFIIFVIQIFATKGHPIFPDKRVGKKGNMIHVLKFRSMYYDAETNIDKYLTPEQKEIWLRERKIEPDPRITKFGRFIRKTSLDELPQLFNIFIGNMSFVGPRPISERELSNFTEEELKILLTAKPGLTGYWQVSGRNNIDFKTGERQKIELEYFTKRGFFYDIGIIFRTVPAVLTKRGAK